MGQVLRRTARTVSRFRLISALIFINIVVSCFVICFSYGLYQNYNIMITGGESDNNKPLNIYFDKEALVRQQNGTYSCGVTKGDALSFLNSLSPEAAGYIDCFSCMAAYEQDIYLTESGEAGEYLQIFNFGLKDGRPCTYRTERALFTDEEYSSGADIIAVSGSLFGEGGEDFESATGDMRLTARRLREDEETVTVASQQFRVIISANNNGELSIPFSSLPEDTELVAMPYDNIAVLSFSKPLVRSVYDEIRDSMQLHFGQGFVLEEMTFTEVSEFYYYRTVLIISVLISLLAAVNTAILFRYMLQRRSRALAIDRICGCSRLRACAMYLGECMLLVLPLFGLSELAFDLAAKPLLGRIFEHLAGAYSLRIYLAIFGIFTGSALVAVTVMLLLTIKKRSITEQKRSAASHRSIVLRVLEAVQLSAVLVLAVSLVSAIESRYALYKPFKDILSREGYMISARPGSGIYLEDLCEAAGVGEDRLIYTTHSYYDIAEKDSAEQGLSAIQYCDRLAELYRPQLSEGEWLTETGHSYSGDGLIPVVLGFSSKHRVGDILTVPDLPLRWDAEGRTIKSEDVRFIVIGRLEENASVVSYLDQLNEPKDYRSIYGTLNSSFEDKEIALMLERDAADLFGRHSVLEGVQFVFKSDLTAEGYEAVSTLLGQNSELWEVSLSEIDSNSREHIYSQLYTVFPIMLCILILTAISSVSICAVEALRRQHDTAVFYICGATRARCILRSISSTALTVFFSAVLGGAVLAAGRATFLKETVISLGPLPLAACCAVVVLYLALSAIMPAVIIGRLQPYEILKEE
ncbi:MAG: hypothetical protein IJ746_03240 [Ruminococcus sp.]|nr:hypothetical protein [Ruminococcus sp.]